MGQGSFGPTILLPIHTPSHRIPYTHTVVDRAELRIIRVNSERTLLVRSTLHTPWSRELQARSIHKPLIRLAAERRRSALLLQSLLHSCFRSSLLSNDFRDDSNRHKISLPHPPTSRGYMWRGRQVYFLVFFFLSLLENLTDFEDFPSPSCPSSCSSSALPGRASTGSSLSCTNRPCAARCEARELAGYWRHAVWASI